MYIEKRTDKVKKIAVIVAMDKEEELLRGLLVAVVKVTSILLLLYVLCSCSSTRTAQPAFRYKGEVFHIYGNPDSYTIELRTPKVSQFNNNQLDYNWMPVDSSLYYVYEEGTDEFFFEEPSHGIPRGIAFYSLEEPESFIPAVRRHLSDKDIQAFESDNTFISFSFGIGLDGKIIEIPKVVVHSSQKLSAKQTKALIDLAKKYQKQFTFNDNGALRKSKGNVYYIVDGLRLWFTSEGVQLHSKTPVQQKH